MRKIFLVTMLMSISSVITANEPVTPADMPTAEQNKMYSIITDYNKCMMQSHLRHSQSGKNVQANAQEIMDGCESNIDSLKTLLTDNAVNPALVAGMAKSLRSKAARHLMARAMNNMAAQAAALDNAKRTEEKAQ